MKYQKYPREEVFRTSNTRRMYVPFYFLFIISIIFLLIYRLFDASLSFGLFWYAILAIFIGIILTEIHRLYQSYEINLLSVIDTRGYLSKKSKRMDLLAISDIEIHQTFFQRILCYGDIHISLISGQVAKMTNIKNPHNFAGIIERKMRKIKSRDNNLIEQPKSEVFALDDEQFVEEHED
ncbi:MAG: PH domain-containing protein [archaeon]